VVQTPCTFVNYLVPRESIGTYGMNTTLIRHYGQ
jgi:hypothetical protein